MLFEILVELPNHWVQSVIFQLEAAATFPVLIALWKENVDRHHTQESIKT